MRHSNIGRKFNRRPNQRKALLAGLVTQLIRHEQIITTVQKAKDLKRLVDKYITMAKKGDLNNRRIAVGRLREDDMVKKLFDVLGPRYASRSGGYARVIKVGPRYGDAADMAVIELVDRDESAKGKLDREFLARKEAEGDKKAA
jgi:large subunit ribosomal protein L17